MQALMPSQFPVGVTVAAPWALTTHDAVPHVVFSGRTRQLLLPLQVPSRPQKLAVSGAHSLSGSCPAGTAAQWPLAWPVFAIEQALHLPVQGPSQQNPSAQ